jgi:hypothetical protein
MICIKSISLLLLFILTSCQVKTTSGTDSIIENHVPIVAKFTVTTPLNISYVPGSTIPFTLTFPKVVVVTGSPKLNLTIGATARTANYVSGSGTAVLIFNYVVQTGEDDTNGIALTSPISLNGGTLMYGVTKNCILTFTLPNFTTVLVDATDPTVTLVTPPSNGTYIAGAILNFSFKFSEKVTVTGTPQLPIILTSGTVYANYLSGSGSDTLLFRYTVLNSDNDANGIALQPLDLNGGTIVDVVSNNAILTYTPPNTTALLLASSTPTITSITPPANTRYLTGQNVDFTVNFNQAVFVTLTPRMAITVDNGTVYANYLSGGGTSALIFRYTVAAGDYNSNGIALVSPLEPNGGGIQNITMTTNALLTHTPPNTASILIDGLDPIISSVTPPANAWYILSNNLNFTVNYSYPVVVTGTPKLSLNIGGILLDASYLSGSGTTALIFSYTVAAGNLDTDGIATISPLPLSGGTLKDIFGDNAGLTFTLPNTIGVLVDAISPTLSSVSAPASATYFINNNVDFPVAFSESVIVTGTPQISLTVGATSKIASYVSGSGSSNLIFRYIVGMGDLDTDGIASASPINLNSGTIKDAAGNNLAGLTFTPPNTTAVLIDGTAASISSITPPANAAYNTGNNVDFIVNLTRNVAVTGSPQIQIDIGGTTVYATYISGTTTSALTFRYTVIAGAKDLNGLALSSPLQLNGGTIKDSSLNNAALTFTPPNTSAILIDGIDLVISSVTPPADATYLFNQNMDFTINYNYVAVVTGSPRIPITVGVTTRYATYLSGSTSTALIFRYSVGATDADADGVTTVGPNLDLNTGTIKDEFNDVAGLAFTAVNYPNKKVEGTVPTISSVAGPSAATYYENQTLDFVATFSEAVNVTGSPRITLTIGAATKYATYLSGTGTALLTFRYTVLLGDLDLDGIASVSPLGLNSGTILDLAGNALSPLTFTPPSTTTVLVDATTPTITSVTAPSNSTYKTTNNVDFIVNYTSPVDVVGSPQISINAGGTTVYAAYNSGSGTTALTFRYIVAAGHSDNNGIAVSSPIGLNGGTMKSPTLVDAGRTFTAPSTTGILVDGIDIAISSITPPSDSTYKIGQVLDFTVNYNYAATVTGVPSIQLTVGVSTIQATYVSGSTTTAHIYRYTVASPDVDTNGITTVGPNLQLNGGTIKDIYADNATTAFTGTNYPNKKVDGVRPTISSMGVSANATYALGQVINFTATYTEAVNITGLPRLTSTVGATTRYADYFSGTGTTSIVFRYTVLAGDIDADGITVASLVDLNSGTILDVSGNAQTTFTFTPPTLTGVLVNGVPPTVISITPPASATYGNTANLNFTVNFSGIVNITGFPTLELNLGGATKYATYVSGTGSTAIVFRYTTVTNDIDTNGVASVSPLALAGGTIRDAALNPATLTFSGNTYSGVLVDALPPSITLVTPPSNGTYIGGTILNFSVQFSENVTVTGTPRLPMILTSGTVYANYLSGSGSDTLLFRYTVLGSDGDTNGIAMQPLDLNGGTIVDVASNNTLLAFTCVFPALLPAVDLRSLKSLVAFSGGGAIAIGAAAILGGDIGTHAGAVTGVNTGGATHIGNTITADALDDLALLSSDLNDLTATAPHAAVFGNGETIGPGVYSIGGAGSVGGVLTLNGGGDPNAFFLIKFNGAMTMGAGDAIHLTNGARSGNVFWLVNGALAIGASAIVKGTFVLGNGGDIALGASAPLEGGMFTKLGGITIGADAIVGPQKGILIFHTP